MEITADRLEWQLSSYAAFKCCSTRWKVKWQVSCSLFSKELSKEGELNSELNVASIHMFFKFSLHQCACINPGVQFTTAIERHWVIQTKTALFVLDSMLKIDEQMTTKQTNHNKTIAHTHFRLILFLRTHNARMLYTHKSAS